MFRVGYRRRSAWRAAAMGLLAVVVTACGSATSTTTTTAGSSTKAGNNSAVGDTACAVISPADIRSTMGITVAEPSSTIRGSVITCTYKAVNRGDSVLIEYDTDSSEATYTAERASVSSRKATPVSISGIGEAAYYFIVSTGVRPVYTVVALQGKLQLVVISASSLDQTKTLAAEVIKKLEAGEPASSSTTTSPTTSSTG